MKNEFISWDQQGNESEELNEEQQERYVSQLHEKITNQIKDLNEETIKQHSLPLARIKRIIKADEDVKMVAAETPAVFAKACEMFIVELSYRS